jgi:putative aldouronate transport system substrate-binding protein
MKMKRTLAILIVLAMTLSLFAACGGADSGTPATTPGTTNETPAADSTSETPVSNDVVFAADRYGLPRSGMEDMPMIEFSIFDRSSNTQPSPDNPILRAIEEITNVRITYEYLVGDEETKISLMIASGEMNDAVFVGGTTGPFIDSGSFIPLEGLIEEHAPNLRSFYAPWWEAMRHSDGHIYIAELHGTPVGTQYVMEHWGSAMWIQKDVLDHFGRAPATLDEYFDFIREYMEIYPDIDGTPTRGFEILATGFKWIDNPPLFLAGHANWGGVWVDLATDTAHNRWAADFVKPWLERLNEEYRNGVVPRDTLILTQDQYHANIASGAVLGFHDQKWAFNSAQNASRADGKHNRTYLPLALTYDGVEPNYVDEREFTGNNGLGISISCKDPVRLIQFMDYCIQEDVQRFLRWGIEGEHWYYNDERRIVRPEEQRELQTDTIWRRDNMGDALYDLMPKMLGSYSDGNATSAGEQPEEYFAGLVDYDKALFAKLGIKTEAAFMGIPKARPSYYPVWSMTIEDGSPAKIGEQRASEANEKFQAALITCDPSEFDEIWAEYQAAIAASGIDDYIAEVNRQILERKAVRGR